MAAIVLFGKLTRKGWLSRSGTLTRIVEALGKHGAAPIGCGVAAIVEVNLYGEGILRAVRVERTALDRRKILELAGGRMLRTIGAISLLCGAGSSGLAVGLGSTAGDESTFVERASDGPAPGGLSTDFSAEGAASAGLLMPAKSSELATGGGGVRGVDSSDASGVASGSAGALASVTSSD